MGTKTVLSVKESYSMKISPKIFTNAYDQAGPRTSGPEVPFLVPPKMAKTGYKSTFVFESDHIILFMFTLISSHQER